MSRRRDFILTVASAGRDATAGRSAVFDFDYRSDAMSGPMQWFAFLATCALSAVWSWRLLTPTEAASIGDYASVPVAGLIVAAAVELLLFFSAHATTRHSPTGQSSPESGKQFSLSPIWLAGVAAILVGQTIATVNMTINESGDRRAAWLVMWEFWAVAAVVVSTVRFLNRFPEEGTRFLLMWLGLTAAIAAYGIWQHYFGYQQLIDTYLPLKHRFDAATQAGRVDPGILRDFAEMGIPTEPGALLLWEQRLLSSREPLGFFALANSLAGLLVTVGVLLCGAICQLLYQSATVPLMSGGYRVPRFRIGIFTLILAEACILFCLLLTKSRTGYAALLVGAGVLVTALLLEIRAARYRRAPMTHDAGPSTDAPVGRTVKGWQIAVAVIVIAAAGIVTAVATGGLDRLVLSESGKSLRYRMEYWTGAVMVLRESTSNLLLGVGPGNFRQRYLLHKLPQSSEEIADPHNLVLDLWTTGGIASLLGLLTIFVAVAMAAFKSRRGAAYGRRELSMDANATSTVGRPTDMNDVVIREDQPQQNQPHREFESSGVEISAWWTGPVIAGLLIYADSSNDERVLVVGVGAAVLSAVLAVVVRGFDALRIKTSASSSSAISEWRTVFAAGWLALTVHLTGAGGISMPAILGIWWLVSAMGTRREATPSSAEFGRQPQPQNASANRPRLLSTGASSAALAIGFSLLGVACWFTSAGPTVAATELIRRGDFALLRGNNIPDALRHYAAAANADPLSIAARQKLSSVSMFQAEQTQGTNQLKGVLEKAIEWQHTVVELDPRSPGARIGLSDVYDSAAHRIAPFDREQAAEFRRLSADAAVVATELYPTGIRTIATAAERLQQAGRTEEAAEMASRALELHRVNEAAGHKDKVLPSMQLKYLERVAKNGKSSALPPVAD